MATLVVLTIICLGRNALALDASRCGSAIDAAERAAGLPHGLLGAIGSVESGRPDPSSGIPTAWPWTINVEGAGHYYDTRDEAISAVVLAQATGRRSIDVGCMQINLMHHPNAFATLDQAFDPAANTAYAADFLLRLYSQTRDWGNAVAAYHSQTPGVADDYRRRVLALWSGSAQCQRELGCTSLASTLRSVRLAAAPLRPRTEPVGGYTAEFRLRLAQNEADDRAFRVAMGAAVPPRRTQNRPRPMLQAMLLN